MNPDPSTRNPTTAGLAAIRETREERDAREHRFWRRNVRWIVALLAIWFVVTFVVAWYARELRFDFFGWPFSFWVGAQGALAMYVLMAALYAWRMNRDPDADQTVAREAGDAPPGAPDYPGASLAHSLTPPSRDASRSAHTDAAGQ